MTIDNNENHNVRVSVMLSEIPRRSVTLTVQSAGQSLTYTVPATSLSNRSWQLLFLHGFPEYEPRAATISESETRSSSGVELYISEGKEVKLFRDRLATIVSNLKIALRRLSDSLNFASDTPTFIKFAESLVEEDRKAGNNSRADKYSTALSQLRRFLHNSAHLDLLPCNFNSDIVKAYNRALKLRGLKPSTIAFYNRILQAIYNKAVSLSLTPDNAPFDSVITQSPKPQAS